MADEVEPPIRQAQGGEPVEPLRAIRVVLMSPLHAGNVGSAARAVKNMGLGGLAVVGLREGRDRDRFLDDARRLAVDAHDVLDHASFADELDATITPSTIIAACSPRGRAGHEPITVRQGAWDLVRFARDRPVAVLFGREDHGLPTTLLARASTTLAIPTSTDYPSLNLAQAVIVVAYELRMAAIESRANRPASDGASAEQLDGLHRDGERALREIDFLKPHTESHIMAELTLLLARATPSARDAELLRAICHQIHWLAGKSGRAKPST